MPGLKPDRAAAVLPFLDAAMVEAEIATPARMAAFLAQLGHESNSLKWMEEIWGPSSAQLRYEGRKDLGNVQPGDGERYRGRGPIQLTGRLNYRVCGLALGLDLEGRPELAATPAVGFRVAAWYWKTRKLNALADAGRFDAITKAINGGTNGAEDRNRRHALCLKALRA
jgi:predicted chitinase